jgi:hypothetical protein
MVEERVTLRDDGVTREQIIERGGDPKTVIVERRGGGFGWIILLLLLIAAGIGVYFMTQANQRGAAETQAVTEAAQDVGKAAGDVADSVGEALDGEK